MIITQATLDALRTEFNLVFNKAYESTEPWWPKVATEVPSGSKSNTYGWIAQILKMRKWVGPRVVQNLSEHKYQITNDRFEATAEVDRDDVEDDNLGLYTSLIMPQLGQAARKHPDQLLVENVLQGNPTAFDGKALFASDHPTYDEAGTSYDNDFDLALTADNFNTVWSTMVSYTGEDGQPLSVIPNTLVIPPQLKKTALQILQATTIAQAIKNVAGTENIGAAAVENMMKGWADPLVIPELANHPTEWFLADCSKPIKPAIWQLRRAAQFVSRDAPNDPKVFDQNMFTYGANARGNVGPTLPFLIARSKP